MKNELSVIFPAKICNVQTSRAILIGFLAELDLPMTMLNELKTALSEAVTNAIVHGYENNEEAANIFITHIEEMNSRMSIPANFNCIDNNDIPMMAKLAAKEANPLYPVPVLWDAMELEKIYII